MREDMEVPVEGGAELVNTASVALKAERYRPRIYGFQLHETAKLQRWQEAVRDRCVYMLFWKQKCFFSILIMILWNRQIARLELLEEQHRM